MKKREKEHKYLFIKEISESIKLLVKRRYEIVFPVLFDILFIFLYGIISGFFGNMIIANLYSAGNALLDERTAAPFTKSIILYLLGFFILLYIVYSVLQGLSWRWASLFAMKKRPKNYIKNFFFVNIVFFALFIIYSIISFSADFFEKEGIVIKIILNLFLLLIIYFALISYVLISQESRAVKAVKESFSLGIHGFIHLIPALVIIAVLFIISNLIASSAGMISRSLMIVFGVLIVFPVITFLRVYFILSISNIKKFIKRR